MFYRASTPRPYLTPRASSPTRSTLAAIAIAAALLVFVGTVAAVVIGSQEPPLDPKTGCVIGGTIEQAHDIIHDQTDPTRAEELRVVLQEIDRRAQALPVGSRLRVHAIVPGGDKLLKPLFDRCKPKTGSMVSSWTGNPGMQDRIHAKEFDEPLKAAKEQLSSKDSYRTSPIIEALERAVNDPAFAQARHRSLTLVSDLVEHSAIVDMYRPPFDFATVRRAGLKPVRDLEGRLAGAEVTLVQVRRAEAGQYQTPAQRKFWGELMEYAGVGKERLRFDRL